MKSNLLSILSLLSSSILGSIFLFAALSKIENLGEFYHALSGIKIIPHLGAGVLTFAIPGLELIIGVCLFARAMLYEAALLATLLLIMFLVFGVYMNLSSDAWTCPCFRFGMPIWFSASGWWVSLRDMLFMSFSCYIVFDLNRLAWRDRSQVSASSLNRAGVCDILSADIELKSSGRRVNRFTLK
jgi:hypothetical protein